MPASNPADFPTLDRDFVALVDGVFADAARRSGPHLLCGPGCTQCCVGVFAMGPADALRLRRGLAELARTYPERAARVYARAKDSWARISPAFPGDCITGRLAVDRDGAPVDAFDEYANDEPCPALDPDHGTCDLYASRPETCREFGPPVQLEEGFGLCELCFQQASADEIAQAAMETPPATLQAAVDQAAIQAGQPEGPTIIAYVLQSTALPFPL